MTIQYPLQRSDHSPRTVYEALIATHDNTLCSLREQWLKAAAVRKPAWMLAIDAALDQRLRLMELRDAPAVSKAA